MSYDLFPFEKVPQGSRIVLYGAGIMGKSLYSQIAETKLCEIVLWLDKNADGTLTQKPEAIENLSVDDYDFVIIAIGNEIIISEVTHYLIELGVPKNKILDWISNNPNAPQTKYTKHEVLNLIPNIEPLKSKNKPEYIVSLTSYGKRLANTAPYAIITILNQRVKPDRVILWVAHEDKEKVSDLLYKLTRLGLEIRFCEDLKSYKKLIPALREFPNDYIITADDDVYYPPDWFEELFTLHKRNPKKIICHRAHGIKVDENHNLQPYRKWNFCTKDQSDFLFPTGIGGILYPPHCFHRDVTNKELFAKLAPHADDIWFWAMAVINKDYFGEESPYVAVSNGGARYLQSIEPEQEQDGNALWNYNVTENGNDEQLKAVIEHYPQIKKTVLHKIKSYC